MIVLRTPDERFSNLPDYDFLPRYLSVMATDGTGLRMHYLDEGPRDGPIVLLLHGEPTWCFLYRQMIPGLVDAGCRVLAPDLIGFGRSDKPSERNDFTYAAHVDWLSQWLTAMDLTDVTLFCQDWGGLLGLRLVADHPGRFARVVASNTALPTGEDVGEGFRDWLAFSQSRPVMEVGRVVSGGITRKLSASEISAYDAPFPTVDYQAGALVFPTLVPVTPDNPATYDNLAAWKALEQFDKPFLTAFGDRDRVLGHLDVVLQTRIPGARGRDHVRLKSASHFSQEDEPDALVEAILSLMDVET